MVFKTSIIRDDTRNHSAFWG